MAIPTPLSQIQPAPLSWLWPHYIPRGKLTLLAADPAAGKSLLTLHLAAQLSQGLPLHPTNSADSASVPTPTLRNPDTPIPPHPLATLLLTEDDPAATLHPRLTAAGANLDLIHLAPDLLSPISPITELYRHADAIPSLALIIIDPLPLLLAGAPTRKAQLAILRDLARFAQLRNLAIVLTTRLPRRLPSPNSRTADPLNQLSRLLDALPAASLAPFILLLARDPNNLHRRILIPAKSNLTAPPPSLAFTITSETPGGSPGLGAPDLAPDPDPHPTPTLRHPDTPTLPSAPTLTWDQSPLPPLHLPTRIPTPVPNLLLEEAKNFILHCLSNEITEAVDIRDAAEENGIAYATLYRAKAELQIVSKKCGDWDDGWTWSLPKPTKTPRATTNLPPAPQHRPHPAKTPGRSPGLAPSSKRRPHPASKSPRKNARSDDHLRTKPQKRPISRTQKQPAPVASPQNPHDPTPASAPNLLRTGPLAPNPIPDPQLAPAHSPDNIPSTEFAASNESPPPSS